MSLILTFDLGTTYFKAGLFDRTGVMYALARCRTPVTQPQPGHVEITPEAFHETIIALAAELRAQVGEDWTRIAAISFASQTNSFILHDAADRPLTPIIVWTDRRANDEHAWMQQFNDLAGRYATTGVPVILREFAIAKLHWLQKYHHGMWKHARRFSLISDELTRWLCGAHVTEVGAAGLTGLLDVHRRQWWRAGVAAAGLDEAMLPRPVHAGHDAGAVSEAAAKALELPSEVRCHVGCLDQFAGAIAADNMQPGCVSETTGTVLAVVRCAERFDATLGTNNVIQLPAYRPNLYYQMCVSNVAGNLLERYRHDHVAQADFAELDRLAGGIDAEAAADLLDLDASETRGEPVFFTPPPTPGHGAMAIMLGCAQRLHESITTLCGNTPPDQITALGGAARSELWRNIKQRVTGITMRRIAIEEPTAYGAARCCMPDIALTR